MKELKISINDSIQSGDDSYLVDLTMQIDDTEPFSGKVFLVDGDLEPHDDSVLGRFLDNALSSDQHDFDMFETAIMTAHTNYLDDGEQDGQAPYTFDMDVA